MTIEMAGIPSPVVAEYEAVPIAFEVRSALAAYRPSINVPFALTEHPVNPPYVKDYDAIGERPREWAARFDTSRWALFLARADGHCVGGAAVAFRTPGLDMLEGRDDLAVLWDIRVVPDRRRLGVGRVLFGTAETWAVAHGCRELKVETQNINVGACRSYARLGCQLRTARDDAYPQCPAETQFLWYKSLGKLDEAG